MGSWCGLFPWSVQTMGRDMGSSCSLPPLPHSHTRVSIPPFSYLPSLLLSSFVPSPSSHTLTHNLALSSLLLFHAFTCPCLCNAFVSRIWSPSRGMLPGSLVPPPPLAFPCWVIVGGIERAGVTAKEVN